MSNISDRKNNTINRITFINNSSPELNIIIFGNEFFDIDANISIAEAVQNS